MSLKLRNIVPVDTANYPEETPPYNDFAKHTMSVEQGHLYYTRCIIKYNDNATEESIQEQVRGPELHLIYREETELAMAVYGTKTLGEQELSGVFLSVQTSDTLRIQLLSFPWSSSSGANLVTYKEIMLIDITDLERDYPYFASLSDKEKKVLLDEALPFINGGETLEFDGVLRNWIVPSENKADWSDGVMGVYRVASLNYRYPHTIAGKSFLYARCDFFYETDNSTENYEWVGIWDSGEQYDIFKFANPIPKQKYTISGSRVASINATNIARGTIHAGGKELVQGKTCYWKQVIVLDLYQDGVYLFFRLLGMDDNAIKSYLDSLPFFVDTYNMGPVYLDKAGFQYYHEKMKALLETQIQAYILNQQLSTLS